MVKNDGSLAKNAISNKKNEESIKLRGCHVGAHTLNITHCKSLSEEEVEKLKRLYESSNVITRNVGQ